MTWPLGGTLLPRTKSDLFNTYNAILAERELRTVDDFSPSFTHKKNELIFKLMIFELLGLIIKRPPNPGF